MTDFLEGQRFWKTGDRRHVWIVDSIIDDKGGQRLALLVAEGGEAEEEVDLRHLLDPTQYTPLPAKAPADSGG